MLIRRQVLVVAGADLGDVDPVAGASRGLPVEGAPGAERGGAAGLSSASGRKRRRGWPCYRRCLRWAI